MRKIVAFNSIWYVLDEFIFAEPIDPEEDASARCPLEAALLCIRHGRQDREPFNVGQHPKSSESSALKSHVGDAYSQQPPLVFMRRLYLTDGQGTEWSLNVPEGQSLTMLKIACSYALLF